MNNQQYFKDLEDKIKIVYDIAESARKKGLDPKDKVEIPLARSLAEKVVGLISTIYPQIYDAKIVKRISELEKEHGKLDPAVAFKIAEEVAKQKYCKFKSLLEAIDAGIRIGFAYLTLGVVSSPLEGFTELKLRKTRDDKDYFVAYFSGPIRSAGTTAGCLVLILIDYLREMFGYAKYDPIEEECKRAVSELNDFHERISNLQYMPTDEEISFLVKNLPIQLAGEASEKLEVSNYKNLERVDTNYLRSGFCLILGEGLAQKAAKGYRLLKSLQEKGFKISDWGFLEEYITLHKKRDAGKTDDSPTYVKDLVAGRPIFGHPSRSGAFRFRYGRSRTNGFSAVSVHPATMAITDGFIAIGTQLKLEKPTKGCVVSVCDDIDGPIVKLYNGSVKKIESIEEAKKIYRDIEEIIYLGDILFPFGDVLNRNHELLKPGYVEEWWELDLREKCPVTEKEVDCFKINFEKAAELSETYQIPLHPKFTYYWSQISHKEFLALFEWLKHANVSKKIILPYTKLEKERFSFGKRALELIGIAHDVTIENVVISNIDSKSLLANIGVDISILEKENFLLTEVIDVSRINFDKPVLEIINSISKFEIKDKAGDFIGARMGRPEKAKIRKLVGSPNVLFPVGQEGGRLRSVQASCEEGKIKSSYPIYFCKTCKKETIYFICEGCGSACEKMYYCPECKNKFFKKSCPEHAKGQGYCIQNLDIGYYLHKAIEMLKMTKEELPPLIKGVRGTSSNAHAIENLAKGILRALFGLQVNKDGTIRYDATEMPLTHFKPKEIFTSVEKLKGLGYQKDIHNQDLVSEEQVLELMPHDVILPASPASFDERADDIFIKIANFVDSLLVRFYGMKAYYEVRKREDLIGKLGVCMAPHNCAGVICRIIGFSNTQGLLASPYMHAAIRRDCDGDEAAVMLLLDVLLNFSKEFLPGHRGGTQDAPLVLNGKIAAGEVDEQILDFEFVTEYPLELYRLAEQRKHSSEVKIPTLRTILSEGKNPFSGFGYTHNTSNLNEGVLCSSYKLLATMQEKVQHQMELVEKIRAVDTSDVARLIIERHFIRDMRGNLRKFSMQQFRCVTCNGIIRRPPLSGVCPVCSGKIIFTIHEGGIRKYLEPALSLAEKYNLSPYIKQTLELTSRYIDAVFGKDAEKQEALQKWF
ncbi:DNA polymerase II large subunit [Candidatus Pacearchaeota archaeon]|nr:DNA polymerase II large subunit [Candidatus Pacearchaeota archaeon]